MVQHGHRVIGLRHVAARDVGGGARDVPARRAIVDAAGHAVEVLPLGGAGQTVPVQPRPLRIARGVGQPEDRPAPRGELRADRGLGPGGAGQRRVAVHVVGQLGLRQAQAHEAQALRDPELGALPVPLRRAARLTRRSNRLPTERYSAPPSKSLTEPLRPRDTGSSCSSRPEAEGRARRHHRPVAEAALRARGREARRNVGDRAIGGDLGLLRPGRGVGAEAHQVPALALAQQHAEIARVVLAGGPQRERIGLDRRRGARRAAAPRSCRSGPSRRAGDPPAAGPGARRRATGAGRADAPRSRAPRARVLEPLRFGGRNGRQRERDQGGQSEQRAGDDHAGSCVVVLPSLRPRVISHQAVPRLRGALRQTGSGLELRHSEPRRHRPDRGNVAIRDLTPT